MPSAAEQAEVDAFPVIAPFHLGEFLNPDPLPTDIQGWRELGVVRYTNCFNEMNSQHPGLVDDAIAWSHGLTWVTGMMMMGLWIMRARIDRGLPGGNVGARRTDNPLSGRPTNVRERREERQTYWMLYNLLPATYQSRIHDGSVGGDPPLRIIWTAWQYVRDLTGNPFFP